MQLLKLYSLEPNQIICYYLIYNHLEIHEIKQISEILDVKPLENSPNHQNFTEIGPILNFITPWSSHVMSLFQQLGLHQVSRIEKTHLLKTDQLPNYDQMTQQIYEVPLQLSDFCPPTPNLSFLINPKELSDFSQREGLGLPESDIKYYQTLWTKKNTDQKHFYPDYPFYQPDLDHYFKNYQDNIFRSQPTDVEIFDLAQSNSEHSRHGTFRGQIKLPEYQKLTDSLFKMIKKPIKTYPNNSILAMCDNSSAIQGCVGDYFHPNSNTLRYTTQEITLHPVLTAETHNFPTGIAPFPGAATGTGGRIRDNQAIGRGGLLLAGTAGYCVGRIDLSQYTLKEDFERIIDGKVSLAKEKIHSESDWYPLYHPEETLIQASNGASDYGNKMGEPVICGFTRSFGGGLFCRDELMRVFEWMKPIMFSGGIGQIFDSHISKETPEIGHLIVRLGGPAYRIGVGGGAASSRSQSNSTQQLDFQAVQRDDAEMENRMNKVIRTLIEMDQKNPIVSIHDQGAGGMGNVTKEIVNPLGGLVSLNNVILGDLSLSAREKWIAEYQEQNTILIHPKSANLLKEICNREKLPIQFVGVVTPTGRIQVTHRPESQFNQFDVVDLNLNQILEDFPLPPVHIPENMDRHLLPIEVPGSQYPMMKNMSKILSKILKHPSVGSKRFLTNKVDRSVTGLVVQQQCVGPYQTPLSNYGIMAQTFENLSGIVTSIGEQPLKMLLDPERGAEMAVGEMLTNLIFCPITKFEDIKCSGNWMFEKRIPEELQALYLAVKSLKDLLMKLEIAIDGGKDSLSMSATSKTKQQVVSPRQLVMTSYVRTPDFRHRLTPDLKDQGHILVLLDLGLGKNRMGGSIFQESVFGNLGDISPGFSRPDSFPLFFDLVQSWIKNHWVVSGHDRSDGGLITTLTEMAISGNFSYSVELPRSLHSNKDVYDFLFNEELGLVFEVLPEFYPILKDSLKHLIPTLIELGRTFPSDHPCMITFNNQLLLSRTIQELRYEWEVPSQYLEFLQCQHDCVIAEYLNLGKHQPKYSIPESLFNKNTQFVRIPIRIPKVAILREQGSNGEREMANAFYQVGFETYDLTTTDLIQEKVHLMDFDGVVFVGGFSYADVLGAGRAWAYHLQSSPKVKNDLNAFYHHPEKFSLGVCNGCQVMSSLGWIEGTFQKNYSQRFESRFSTVTIPQNQSSIMFQNMESLTFGIWVAHGEGRYISNKSIKQSSICLQYTDHKGQPTDEYPENPNGSSLGITGVCDETGRHLAMMPHPERSIYLWQLPYIPPEIKTKSLKYSPWLQMFQNAYYWCQSH